MISYRNPDESMARLHDGRLSARGRTRGARCRAGDHRRTARQRRGTLLGRNARAHRDGISRGARSKATAIASATLTNTLVDFSIPGDLGVFTDEDTIARLEKRMRERGYLEPAEMARTFDWMRSSDLIWSYVVNNWFKGKQPSAFDILAWNNDSTRMPVEMHSQYLRACYLHNSIVKPNAFTIGDTPIDLEKIVTPLYVLGAENDHIAPWRATYLTTQHVGGEAKYVLTNSGHIAGIVNPPGGKKTWHYTQPSVRRGESADEWLESADRHQGSWWQDWAAMGGSACGGPMRAPYPIPRGRAGARAATCATRAGAVRGSAGSHRSNEKVVEARS